MATRQIAQSKVSNSRTSEPFHFISDRVEHAANLIPCRKTTRNRVGVMA